MADAPRDDDDDAFDEARDTPDAHWIKRLREKPGTREVYRLVVFVIGLAFIALGIALAVLPGPLTIPPVLLGLYIWSKEFRFAEKLFDGFQEKAKEAWEHAKAKPKSSAALTVFGLILAGAAFWAVAHYELVDKAKDFVGL